MACGTPVIAFKRGSVPEVLDHGVTGFIVEDETAAVAAVNRLHTLSRTTVRECFEKNFTSKRMAQEYVRSYEAIIQKQRPRLRVVE
jgi:glycosyltransferase involved in cell wall biosynthesis